MNKKTKNKKGKGNSKEKSVCLVICYHMSYGICCCYVVFPNSFPCFTAVTVFVVLFQSYSVLSHACVFVALVGWFIFFATPYLLPLGVFYIFLFFAAFSVLFFFPIDLSLTCVCVVMGIECNIPVQLVYVVVLSGWQVASGVVGFFRREQCDLCTSMDLAYRRLTPDFTFFFFVAEA